MRGDSGVFARDNPPGPTPQELLAPFFLGTIVNYFLWGVQTTQSYYYYKSYRKTDRPWTKVSVGILVVTDAIQSITTSQQGWRYLVEGWGDLPGVLQFPGWGTYLLPLTDAITAAVVQIFYATKIHKFLDPPYNYVGAGVVIILSCVQLMGGVACGVVPFSNMATVAEFTRHKNWAYIWLSTSTVTDILITVIMTWKLSKSRTDYSKTNDMISKMIRGIVETGLATALVQFVTLVTYLVFLKNSKPYFIFLGCIVSKVYTNSILVLLNSRKTDSNGELWETSRRRTVNEIRIHSTQTVDVTGDHVFKDRLDTASKRPPFLNNSLTNTGNNTLDARSPSFHQMETSKDQFTV